MARRDTRKRAKPSPMHEALEKAGHVPAPELAELAAELIPLHHSQRWAAPPQILYFFSEKAPKAGGTEKTAVCKKVGGFSAYLLALLAAQHKTPVPETFNRDTWLSEYSEPEDYNLPTDRHVVEGKPIFCIIAHYGRWLHLEENQKRALVDHELTHIEVQWGDKGLRYGLRPHDIEEFGEIVMREGAWHAGLQTFDVAMSEGELLRRGGKAGKVG